jgi:hypothetical protein
MGRQHARLTGRRTDSVLIGSGAMGFNARVRGKVGAAELVIFFGALAVLAALVLWAVL